VPKRGHGPVQDRKAPDNEELASFVCAKFCRGLTVSEIKAAVKDELKIDLSREQPYEILRRAALDGRLQHVVPQDSELTIRLRDEYPWLRGVRVLRSVEPDVVAQQAALVLFELMARLSGDDLHIGFGGGGVMQGTVRQLASMLRKEPPPLKRLFLHSLIAASEDPTVSPNSFLRWFFEEPRPPFKIELVGLPTPGLVSPAALKALKQIDEIKSVFEQAATLNVLVTSAGAHWGKEEGCSGLYKLYEAADKTSRLPRELHDQGCVGDVLWQPLGAHGPLRPHTGIRAVTLVDLEDMPRLVEQGKQVVLVLAPCGSCRQPKTEVLRAVVNCRPPMITHLVADSRTVRGLFGTPR